jgi:hypothetical protein
MANAIGTAEINFGAFPGANDASIAVTGQTGISATSKAEAFIMADDTSTDGHTANDHRYANMLMGLTCGTPTAGTGFTIYGTSQHKLLGKFALRWVWSD